MKQSSDENISNNIGLVYKIVNKFIISNFDKDDLIQAGLMGLYKASLNFKEELGYKFSTYAVYYILGEVKREYNKIINKVNKDIKVSLLEDSEMEYIIYLKGQENRTVVELIDPSKLTDEENKLLNLLFVEKLTQVKIAKIMNISQSSISRRIKKIKNKLK